MWFLWLYTRIFVLPTAIYAIEKYTIPVLATLDKSYYFVPFMHSMAFFLSCMCFLHFYWFFMISQMLYGLAFGKYEDLQKKDTDLKTQSKKKN
jgi:hypothetical protein